MENLGYKRIEPTLIEDNLINLIATDWMLVTAGNKNNFNTMTANWGGVGYLWNKPVVFVFVRPERYTYEFTESSEMFTLTFFDKKDKQIQKALNICGSVSGRDCDKIAEASLIPLFTSMGNPTFEKATLVMECKKLYAEILHSDAFADETVIRNFYEERGGLHKMYIAEIVNAWTK